MSDSHERALKALARRGRLRTLQPRSGIDFSSNDYLGLAASPELAEAVARALDRGVAVGAGGSRLLRGNDPAAGRWYSRDTAAIAMAQGLGPVAPWFLDADARGDGAQPLGGLTVVRFRNSHLGYALTWFSLAALWAGWLLWARRRGLRD